MAQRFPKLRHQGKQRTTERGRVCSFFTSNSLEPIYVRGICRRCSKMHNSLIIVSRFGNELSLPETRNSHVRLCRTDVPAHIVPMAVTLLLRTRPLVEGGAHPKPAFRAPSTQRRFASPRSPFFSTVILQFEREGIFCSYSE
jgi:hypothetical protein